jgi:hypothetical protein
VTENLYDADRRALVESILGRVDGPCFLVDPSVEVLEALADYGTTASALPEIRLLAREPVLKSVRDDFLIAADIADLAEQQGLEIRLLQGGIENTLFVSDGSLYAVVAMEAGAAGLAAEDETFLEDTYATYDDIFETAPSFDLRTPGRTRVGETLEDVLGEQTRADFDAVLASLDSVGDDLDEVAIALLVTAKNEQLLYDVSRWGEDVGMASKATFSRTKTNLEDAGLLDTEKVPIDVGRPRQRLLLGHDTLQSADTDELAFVARDLLG